MDKTITYESLLGISDKIDPVTYRKRFKPKSKNAEGIPLELEAEVEKRGQAFAVAYEKMYDARKAEMSSAGHQTSLLDKDDNGNLVAVNLVACVTVPAFVKGLEQSDGPLFAVMVLHWMRASGKKEWVFSHLCEAVHAYYSIKRLRDELGEPAEYPFDDLRDYLREAVYHFNHRHC